MALEQQEIEIPLNLGMATKPSAELQAPDTLRLVQNLHWRSLGELERRPTHGVNETVVGPSGGFYADNEACGLIVRDGNPAIVTGRYGVVNYNERLGDLQYARQRTTVGTTPSDELNYCPVSYDVSRRFVERSQGNLRDSGIFQVASAQHNGVHVIAWITRGSTSYLRCKAIDVETGEVVATTEYVSLSSGSALMVQACEYTEVGKEGVLIAYIDGSVAPFTVATLRYDAASNEFVTDSSLTTNSKTTIFAMANNGTHVVFGFTDNTSGFMTVQNRTISTVASTHTGTHGADTGIAIVLGSTQTLIISCTSGTAYAERFNSPASVATLFTASSEGFSLAYVAIEALSGGAGNDAVAYIACGSTGSSPATIDGSYTRYKRVNFDAAAPSLGAGRTLPHAVPMGAFTLQGMAHLVAGLYITQSSLTTGREVSCLVLRHRGRRHDSVARICHDRFFANLLTFQSQLHVTSVSGTNAWVLLPADSGADSLGGFLPQALFLERISAVRPLPMTYAQPSPGVTMVAGGQLWEFDGETAYEATPLHYPRAIASDAGAGTSTGTFTIVPLWRFVDRAGRLHQIPGEAVTIGPLTTEQIDVYVSICPARAFDNSTVGLDMEPEIYINDGTNSTLYLANASGAKHTYNTTSSNGLWYKFTDVQPGVAGNPEYPFSVSGEIAPEPPPAAYDVAKVVDRMVLINAEDRGEIWHSKPIIAGRGVEWSATNTFRIEDDCTKIVEMADRFVVLARGGIYTVGGEGPTASNVGSFTPPYRLNSTVDCIDPASVCRVPMGVVFRGRRGFYLLDNGMNVQPWGVPIDPEVLTDPALDPSVSTSYRMRVVFQEQTNEIQICGIPGGDRLVYNVVEDKWSKYDITGAEVRDLAVARGKLWHLSRISSVDTLRDELLYSSSGAAYNSDAGTSWEIDTPWFRPDQEGGQVRLWREWLLMKLPSDVADVDTLTLSYYVDNIETVVGTATYTGAELAAIFSTTGEVARLPFVPPVQVVRSFKFVFTCTFTGATSGPKPLAMRLRYGARPSKGKRSPVAVKG